jgi:hypothetical protein
MRTTVTLDADVMALIRTALKGRGTSFKETLNTALGLDSRRRGQSGRPFVQKTFFNRNRTEFQVGQGSDRC